VDPASMVLLVVDDPTENGTGVGYNRIIGRWVL
jgi:hypothetical protein